MLWLGIFVVVLLIFVLIWWFTREQPKCPECGSEQIGISSRRPQGMRTFDYHANSEAGGRTTVQSVYEVTYRCNQCQATWHKTVTESR